MDEQSYSDTIQQTSLCQNQENNKLETSYSNSIRQKASEYDQEIPQSQPPD